MLQRGAAVLCLLLSLTACASRPAVRTETVEVRVPVVVSVPDELVAQEPEPRAERLPPGQTSCPPGAPPALANCDLLDLIDRLKAWGRQGWCRVERVGNLGPREDSGEACERLHPEL